MKRILIFIMTYIVSVGIADAAVRDTNAISRKSASTNNSVVSRTNTTQRTNARTTTSRATVSRQPDKNTSRTTTSRSQSNVRTGTTSRAARATTTSRAATMTPRTSNTKVSRSATNISRPARAASITASQSQTFGTGYNACRDAYFTCMDQFCATQNESYRRCTCSSRLNQIKSRENLLSQTAEQLQDFKDFNLSVIDKSAAEVKAMINATSGEYIASSSSDRSESAKQLSSIGSILSQAKSKSLSTAGTVDIGGDIKQIWQTTDLANGADIANLTGESLYNAVHAQCSQMVAETCESKSTLNMVVSAYGMYIENDCTTLSNSLDSKTNAAKGSVRDTEREMHNARLDNYDAHNSTSINDCVALVRADITANTACGPDYVHCLDVTGRYLNRETGEPIYTSEFYQLNGQISLSGNILTNQTNRMIVAELNRMRSFANLSLDTCRDLADDVWDEFVRQAITEIYQGQQERIRTVKNECLDVVNACYDEKNQSLKDFSNVKEQLLLGQRLELSEELCREKLDACSNLYGGGSDGLQELLVAMHELTDSKIAKQCRVTLQEYARDICAVPSNDTLHAYPYSCRVYAPGEQKYAQIYACNQQLWSTETGNYSSSYIPPTNDGNGGSGSTPGIPTVSNYSCPALLRYTSCAEGYYMTLNGVYNNGEPQIGNQCTPCPDGYTCAGGTADKKSIEPDTPENPDSDTPATDLDKYGHDCGDYAGSLYQRLVRYAIQTCIRPSDANSSDYSLSIDVLQDVNAVMDSIRVDMGKSLAYECERLGGTWVDAMWIDNIDKGECNDQVCIPDIKGADNIHDKTGDTLYKKFYDETGANTKWGYCKPDNGTSNGTGSNGGDSGGNSGGSSLACTEGETYTITLDNTTNSDCCPESGISTTSQEVSVVCGEFPKLSVIRATCTTNPNCVLSYYSDNKTDPSDPAAIYFSSNGESPSIYGNAALKTIYSYWGEIED
ncbi:MAG: hypothetical protein IJ500_04180 [Alphaproteobacteria bacterium]|nr:hypothetical protein [Alphaproteobacteria bacterium]